MSPHELARLERLETFIDRLKLNSYLAKAAGEGGRVMGDPRASDAAEQRLASAATDDNNVWDDDNDYQWSLVMELRDRIKELEQTVERLTSRPPAGQPNVTAQGEAVLAKAVSGFHDAGSLLAYADRVVDDVTTMGVISGHLAAGDMLEAKKAVLEAVERTTVAKAPDVMAQVVGAGTDADLASYDARAATSELMAKFGKIERLMSSLEVRLSQLERRPHAAAPVDDEGFVAKAAAPKRPRTKEETEARLMAQIDAYCDSPSVVGQLSSMVTAGQYAEVRKVLSGAKRAHDAAKISAERKKF